MSEQLFELSIGLSDQSSIQKNLFPDQASQHLKAVHNKYGSNVDQTESQINIYDSPFSEFKEKKQAETTQSSHRPRSPHPSKIEMPIVENAEIRSLKHSPHRNTSETNSRISNLRTNQSLKERRNIKKIKSRIDSGLIRDQSGKLRVREDPAAEFAREWEKRKNDPPTMPEDSELKGGEWIKST